MPHFYPSAPIQLVVVRCPNRGIACTLCDTACRMCSGSVKITIVPSFTRTRVVAPDASRGVVLPSAEDAGDEGVSPLRLPRVAEERAAPGGMSHAGGAGLVVGLTHLISFCGAVPPECGPWMIGGAVFPLLAVPRGGGGGSSGGVSGMSIPRLPTATGCALGVYSAAGADRLRIQSSPSRAVGRVLSTTSDVGSVTQGQRVPERVYEAPCPVLPLRNCGIVLCGSIDGR